MHGKVITRILEEYRKYNKENQNVVEEKIEELQEQKKNKPSKTGVIVKGIDNCLIKLSKCCNPVQGDDIIGYITRGRGVTVHRTDCKNVKDLLKDEGRIIECYWDKEKETSYNVDITLYANDRDGLLGDVINVIATSSARLVAISAKANKEKIATIEMTIDVRNVSDLTKTQRELGKIDSVYEVKRKK